MTIYIYIHVYIYIIILHALLQIIYETLFPPGAAPSHIPRYSAPPDSNFDKTSEAMESLALAHDGAMKSLAVSRADTNISLCPPRPFFKRFNKGPNQTFHRASRLRLVP